MSILDLGNVIENNDVWPPLNIAIIKSLEEEYTSWGEEESYHVG